MSTLSVDTIQGQTATASVDLSNATSLKMPPGSIIQEVRAVRGSGTAVDFTFNAAARLGCVGATITPKFANSKIRITGFCHLFMNTGSAQCGIGFECVHHPSTIFNGGASVAVAGTVVVAAHQDCVFTNAGQWMGNIPFDFEHSPGNTNAISYSIAVSENGLYAAGTSQHCWSNGTTGGRSKIVLQEISQ